MDYRKQGRKYEKDEAKDWNGKSSPGSGCHWAAKADIKTDKYLIETKFTTTDKYVLQSSDIVKLFNYAYRANRIPIFQVGFYGGNDFVIIDYNSIDMTFETEKITTKGKSKTLNKKDLMTNTVKEIVLDGIKLLIMSKARFKQLDG